MKQGQATHSGSGSTKTEPRSNAVDPGAVSRIGTAMSPFADNKPLYEGRGLEAPMKSETSHKSGSQGKY